jgi:hypothetical protein
VECGGEGAIISRVEDALFQINYLMIFSVIPSSISLGFLYELFRNYEFMQPELLFFRPISIVGGF